MQLEGQQPYSYYTYPTDDDTKSKIAEDSHP